MGGNSIHFSTSFKMSRFSQALTGYFPRREYISVAGVKLPLIIFWCDSPFYELSASKKLINQFFRKHRWSDPDFFSIDDMWYVYNDTFVVGSGRKRDVLEYYMHLVAAHLVYNVDITNPNPACPIIGVDSLGWFVEVDYHRRNYNSSQFLDHSYYKVLQN